MSTNDCEHSIGNDPRKANQCVKCGRTLGGRWIRNMEREAELVQRAAGLHDVSDLVQFAQGRAGTGQVRRLRSRSFYVEIREELSDAVNYFAWLEDQRILNGDEGLSGNELAALHHVVQAWRHLHSRDSDW